jgi:hypothetical protein
LSADKAAVAVSQLASQLDEITRIVRFEPALLDLRVERVSRWSVGQQLDHILKVLDVSQRLLDGNPQPLPRGMNLLGRCVMAAGWFPRGFAKSPKFVVPADEPPADLAERAAHLRKVYCETALPAELLADRRPVYPHPVFGGLSAVEGLRFLGIHTRHHLKIVSDIRRAG